jgi:hypothetical protein
MARHSRVQIPGVALPFEHKARVHERSPLGAHRELGVHSVRTNSAVLLATESFLSSNFSSRRSKGRFLKSIASRMKPDKRGIYRTLSVDS